MQTGHIVLNWGRPKLSYQLQENKVVLAELLVVRPSGI